MPGVIEIEGEEHLNTILKESKAAGEGDVRLINVGAGWCGSCRQLKPRWAAAAMDAKYAALRMYKVDVSEHEEVSEALEVASLPTFVTINGGVVTNKYSGSKWEAVVKLLDDAAAVAKPPTNGAAPAAPTAAPATTAAPAPQRSSAPGVTEIDGEDDLQTIIKESKTAGEGDVRLINVGAGWCGSCRQLKPRWAAAAMDAKYAALRMYKVDVSEHEEVSEALEVASLPTFVTINGGVVTNKYSGSKWEAVVKLLDDAAAVAKPPANGAAPAAPTAAAVKRASTSGGEAAAGGAGGDGAPRAKRTRVSDEAEEPTAVKKGGVLGAGFRVAHDCSTARHILNMPYAVFPGGFRAAQTAASMSPAAAGAVAEGGASGSSSAADAAHATAKELNRHVSALFGKFVAEDGTGVDYAALRASPDFASYVSATSQLLRCDVRALDADADVALAFWLNCYNALVVHGKVIVGAPDASVKGSLGKFFGSVSYAFGFGGSDVVVLSLDDIEHGILRANAKHVTSGALFFPEGDPRVALARSKADSRVHFALNCGARSCPPIRVFSPDSVQRWLDVAARAFLCRSRGAEVVLAGGQPRSVRLSKILDWYGRDFAPTAGGVVAWCAGKLVGPGASDEERKLGAALTGALLALGGEAKIPVEYGEYDWASNDA